MNTSAGCQLNAAGYFERAGARVVPVGVNYWPASCGVEMWKRWPERELQHDLDLLVRLGLNSVRCFLFWPDFEPELGRYEPAMFFRLGQYLGWCRQRGLLVQPTLFVGFMSGGQFWPIGKGQRNLFADPGMVESCVQFARKAAQVMASYHDVLLGIDLGNELICIQDSADAGPQAVEHWCRRVCDAIRSVYPSAMVVSGLDNNQVIADRGWHLGHQPGTDYYSMHGYPVPAWQPVQFDGLTDPLAHGLLPFYVRCARAFGPVLLQEFGTIVTGGPTQQRSYLEGMLERSWQAGANGLLWWCMRDIPARITPYATGCFEGTLGLVDAQDRV